MALVLSISLCSSSVVSASAAITNSPKSNTLTSVTNVSDYGQNASTAAVTVKSIAVISAEILQDQVYTLPSKITCKMSNKSSKKVAVKWNKSFADTSVPGVFNFTGKVTGTTKKAYLELTVIARKLTVQEIAKKVDAVVLVENIGVKGKAVATGSGFIISSDGKFVTNYHVIQDAYSVEVVTNAGLRYKTTGVLGYSKDKDIAILQMENVSGLPTLELADSSSLTLAEDVVVIGSPLGLQNTVSTGIISALNREAEGRDGEDIQISAPITHGSSGGPVFNSYGKVIGMAYAGMETQGNLNFVIPINEVKLFLSVTKLTTVTDASEAYLMRITAEKAYTGWIYIDWKDVYDASGYYLYWSNDGKKWNKMSTKYTRSNAFFSGVANGEMKCFAVTYVVDGVESNTLNQMVIYTMSSNHLRAYPNVPVHPRFDYNVGGEFIYDDGTVEYNYSTARVGADFAETYYEEALKADGYEYIESATKTYTDSGYSSTYGTYTLKDTYKYYDAGGGETLVIRRLEVVGSLKSFDGFGVYVYIQ